MTIRRTFLTDQKIAAARLAFRQMFIRGPEDGDRFFEAYGPGNTIEVIESPFERFEDYELLLRTLKTDDPDKYEEIHKGTPFYFMAWTAFDLQNYERAVFYMDAAISEDIRKDPTKWLENPGSKFLTLSSLDDQVAKRITEKLRNEIEKELNRFNTISKLEAITTEKLVEKFVKVLVQDKSKRSIITALYSFLLEYEDRFQELGLRSSEGGSIEPFLSHLFKGCQIFESLLKHLYPNKDNGQNTETLGDIFETNDFNSDFPNFVKTKSTSLNDICKDIKSEDIQTAFNTTYNLRNTTSHNLVWDDIFDDAGNYTKFYQQILNAVLFIIAKKYL